MDSNASTYSWCNDTPGEQLCIDNAPEAGSAKQLNPRPIPPRCLLAKTLVNHGIVWEFIGVLVFALIWWSTANMDFYFPLCCQLMADCIWKTNLGSFKYTCRLYFPNLVLNICFTLTKLVGCTCKWKIIYMHCFVSNTKGRAISCCLVICRKRIQCFYYYYYFL